MDGIRKNERKLMKKTWNKMIEIYSRTGEMNDETSCYECYQPLRMDFQGEKYGNVLGDVGK